MCKLTKAQLKEILDTISDDTEIVIQVEDMEKGTILKPISSARLVGVVEKEETFIDAFDRESYKSTVMRESYGQKTNKKVLHIR